MDLSKYKHLRFFGKPLNSITCKSLALILFATIFILTISSIIKIDQNISYKEYRGKNQRFLEVPQIVWGFNNQKIAFARACLTARMLNRTLLMPSLSASLFYKEVDLLKPITFDKVFKFQKFNSLCKGFIQLAHYSDISNQSNVFQFEKGSGRRWTNERDFEQLIEFNNVRYDKYEVIKIIGKNPFMWNDHWPVKDYAKVFECLVLVDEISKEADKVVSKIQEIGNNVNYVAVHMRIEKDWMIHCKKREQRMNLTDICSNKKEIIEKVGNIASLKTPIVVYLAVADTLLEDNSILNGWKNGLLPYEKKKLGVFDIYKKQPYLFQSAIDYEVCLRSKVFVGNSYSTFSSLMVLDRTQKMIRKGGLKGCGVNGKWSSYAYNLNGEFHGPRSWVTNMSDTSLQAISYGSNQIFC